MISISEKTKASSAASARSVINLIRLNSIQIYSQNRFIH